MFQRVKYNTMLLRKLNFVVRQFIYAIKKLFLWPKVKFSKRTNSFSFVLSLNCLNSTKKIWVENKQTERDCL